MKATVGRVVHVYTENLRRQAKDIGKGPYAAIVVQVADDPSFIVAKVMPPFAQPYDEGPIPFSASAEHPGYSVTWCWPPQVPREVG